MKPHPDVSSARACSMHPNTTKRSAIHLAIYTSPAKTTRKKGEALLRPPLPPAENQPAFRAHLMPFATIKKIRTARPIVVTNVVA
jgi:hypothetical protein